MAGLSLDKDRQAARVHLAGDLLEQFFISAVVAVLAIRIYLQATGFPQVGGNGLHIAHLLWGGLLMLISIVLTLSFLGRHNRSWVAVLGGIGFGTFIDELGKFITSDYNYFYRPAWIVIYLIFILMFFTFTAISRRQHPTGTPALATALDMVQDSVLYGLGKNDREVILRLLDDADASHPLTRVLREVVADLPLAEAHRPGLLARLRDRLRDWYRGVTRARGFRTTIVIIWTLSTLSTAVVLGASVVDDPKFSPSSPAIGVIDVIHILVVLVSAALAVIGIVALTRHRYRLYAYQWFRLAILVSLLIGEPIAFYDSEIFATGGLVVDLVCLAVFNYGISLEISERESRGEVSEGHNPGFLGAPIGSGH